MYIELIRRSCSPLGVFPEGSRQTVPDAIAVQWIKDGVARQINPTRIPMERLQSGESEPEAPPDPQPNAEASEEGVDATSAEASPDPQPRRRRK